LGRKREFVVTVEEKEDQSGEGCLFFLLAVFCLIIYLASISTPASSTEVAPSVSSNKAGAYCMDPKFMVDDVPSADLSSMTSVSKQLYLSCTPSGVGDGAILSAKIYTITPEGKTAEIAISSVSHRKGDRPYFRFRRESGSGWPPGEYQLSIVSDDSVQIFHRQFRVLNAN
jgi:hypothetical protein